MEQAPQAVTDGFTPGHEVISTGYWLSPEEQLNSTWLAPVGSYAITFSLGTGLGGTAGQVDPVEVFINGRLLATEEVPVAIGGTFTIPVGTLPSGQYSVEIYNDAPVGPGVLSLGGPGFSLYSFFEVGRAAPTLDVADAGGVYDGSTFPASASVAGVGGVPGTSLEGAAPVLTYYAGGTAAGTPLAGPPTAAGTYTVTAAFPGSADYAPATTQATFTIGQATPTVLVTDAGGVYHGSSFPASASVAGVSGVPGSSLEGILPS